MFFKKNKKEETTEIKFDDNNKKIKFDTFDELYYNNYKLNFDYSIQNELDLIKKWRNIADNPDVDDVIEEILNDAIIEDKDGNIVKLNLDKTDFSNNIKDKIFNEFNYILNVLNFNNKADEYFKRWFIDGRLYTQNIYKKNSLEEGIMDIKLVNPFNIIPVIVENKKYFLYYNFSEKHNVFNNKEELLNKSKKVSSDFNIHNINNEALLIPETLINYIDGAIYSNRLNMFVSPIEKAVKRINQLQLLEDHILVYRIVRASEKRVFYIDVGKMSSARAKEYLKKLAREFSREFSYNPETGEVNSKKAFSNMIENIWLTRRDGKSTEITTLGGAQNLGELSDLDYFERKFYIAMKVPLGRKLKTENMFVLGKTGEITREEIKFSKYISKLRRKFSKIILEPLYKQLLVKNIITEEELNKNINNIKVIFNNNNLYEMLKEFDILTEKLDIISNMNEYIGKYFSVKDIHNIIGRSDDEIKAFYKELDNEYKNKILKKEENDNNY